MQPTYEDFVMTLAKPGQDIVSTLTPMRAHMLHMAVGISGEAGELLDATKKVTIYNKPIDRENVVEELGDLKFYITGLMVALGITEEEVERYNRTKLGKRFEGLVYSDQAAQDRADKSDGLASQAE